MKSRPLLMKIHRFQFINAANKTTIRVAFVQCFCTAIAELRESLWARNLQDWISGAKSRSSEISSGWKINVWLNEYQTKKVIKLPGHLQNQQLVLDSLGSPWKTSVPRFFVVHYFPTKMVFIAVRQWSHLFRAQSAETPEFPFITANAAVLHHFPPLFVKKPFPTMMFQNKLKR